MNDLVTVKSKEFIENELKNSTLLDKTFYNSFLFIQEFSDLLVDQEASN
jgi:hypothetical protein